MRKFLQTFAVLFLTVTWLQADELQHYSGKNYTLTLGGEKTIALTLIKRHDSGEVNAATTQGDDQSIPFLSGISFDGATLDWKTFFFKTSGLDAEVVEETPEKTVYTFRYRFSGTDAKLIAITGTAQAYPDWLHLTFQAVYQGDLTKMQHKRALFAYADATAALTAELSESGVPDPGYGIRLDSEPHMQLYYHRPSKHANMNPLWTRDDAGNWCTSFELAFTPYFGTAPLFRRIGGELDACFTFSRDNSIILSGDPLTTTLHLLNRTDAPVATSATLTVTDHRDKLVAPPQLIPVDLIPGATSAQAVELPAGRYGFFTLTLEQNGQTLAQHSYGVLPPTERKHKAGSIFGGSLYVFNPKTVKQLDLLEWCGLSLLRGFPHIVTSGTQLPSPVAGVYQPDAAQILTAEYWRRGIELYPRVSSVLEMPPGTFQRMEGANEQNIRRLPVDYAEELKINYIKAKQHDPAIEVGTTGMAGVDLLWLEELQENGGWDYFDSLVVHLHCFPRAPEVNNTMTREYWLHDRVTLLRELMDRYGEKTVYDSENGYLTQYPDRRVENYPLRAVSQSNTAAAFMVRSYLQALAFGLKNKLWFTVDTYGGFGLIEYNQPTPAYPAYAAMTWMLDGVQYAGELLSPGRVSAAISQEQEFIPSWFGQATPGLEKELLNADRETAQSTPNPDLKPYTYLRTFATPDKQPLLVAWATLKRADPVRDPIDTPAWKDQKPAVMQLWNGQSSTEEPASIPIRFDTGADTVEVADLMGNRQTRKTDAGWLTLELDDFPQFIFGANPKLLTEARQFSLNLFPSEFVINDQWKTLVQAVFPKERTHPQRKSVFDKSNLSATLKPGEAYPVSVRLSNLGEEKETGRISLHLPEGWNCQPESVTFAIAAGEEKVWSGNFQVTPNHETSQAKIVSEVISDRLGKIAASVMNVAVTIDG